MSAQGSLTQTATIDNTAMPEISGGTQWDDQLIGPSVATQSVRLIGMPAALPRSTQAIVPLGPAVSWSG